MPQIVQSLQASHVLADEARPRWRAARVAPSDLFPVLRVLADRPRRPATFLVLGSASPQLLKQSSETLAGRISYYELDGFGVPDVGHRHWRRLWLRGGYPRSDRRVV